MSTGTITLRADLTRLQTILSGLSEADAAWLATRAEPPWRGRQRRLDNRDGTLRTAAAVLFAGATKTNAARQLSTRIDRYLATTWEVQQHLDVLPDDADPAHVFLHDFSKLNAGRGMEWRQIYNVLSNNRGR